MKILYLKLTNFANIYTAMKKKTIEIDFSKGTNRVVLLIGKNGSGKTSILSELHPFAYSGNMDVRNNTSLIMDDLDGYKEIHIKDSDDIYIIKHFYKNSKRGIMLKSFIQLNGLELNPNGNVTSFLEKVREKLSIDQDYLKLIRLGPNVTNFIEMKSTERKKFMSDLLSDVDIYNNYYKKISEDSKFMKNMIKNISDKLSKLDIADKELLEKDIMIKKESMNELEKKCDDIKNSIGIISGKVSTILSDSIDNFKNNLSEMSITKNLLFSQCEDIKKKIGGIFNFSINSDIDKPDIIKNKINNIQTSIAVNKSNLSHLYNNKNNLYNERTELMNRLKYYKTSEEKKELEKLAKELNLFIEKNSAKYKDFNPKYSKDNMMTVLNILREINDVASIIYTFDIKSIKMVIDYIIENKMSIKSYVNNLLSDVDEKIRMIDISNTINIPKAIITKDMGCIKNKCPYYNLYKNQIKISNEYTSIDSLNDEKDRILSMLDINTNIEYIMKILKMNRNIIEEVNIPQLSLDNIFKSIKKQKPIYDEDDITNIILEIEEYEDYENKRIKYLEIQNEINKLNTEYDSLSVDRERLIVVENDIAKCENDISKLLNREKDMCKKISKYNTLLEKVNSYNELCKMYSDTENKYLNISKEISDKCKLLDNIYDEMKTSEKLNNELSVYKNDIEKLSNFIMDAKIRLSQYIYLSEELKLLNNKYDKLSIIREALSSSKGIPLLYIQLLLKNTKSYVNELLNTIYSNNELEIDDFEINGTEFNIPYIKNGIRISDVVFASQGEKSFLSLALSFALILQSLDKYNILLLDELDSTLDYRNRPLFLNILEKQMNIINAEQIFLITHNDMFDSYPSDIIMTSDVKYNITPNNSVLFKV